MNPRIDFKEITLLWHSDYYDGPLSGLCLYQGRKCWFFCVDEDDQRNRTYTVHEMPAADLEEAEYWHDLFRQHVGTHTDYNAARREPDGRLGEYKVHPQSEWHKFYDLYDKAEERAYHKNPILGEFVW